MKCFLFKIKTRTQRCKRNGKRRKMEIGKQLLHVSCHGEKKCDSNDIFIAVSLKEDEQDSVIFISAVVPGKTERSQLASYCCSTDLSNTFVLALLAAPPERCGRAWLFLSPKRPSYFFAVQRTARIRSTRNGRPIRREPTQKAESSFVSHPQQRGWASKRCLTSNLSLGHLSFISF